MIKTCMFLILVAQAFSQIIDELEKEEEFGSGDKDDKRVIMPGTLWCGNGDNADADNELGAYSDVDQCCRNHDHCNRQVSGFSKDFGYRNFRPFTVSDCQCDFDFYNCLKNANIHKTAAKIVGKLYFDVLRMPCLRFNKDGTRAFKGHSPSYRKNVRNSFS